jgi:hypothetical protein
MHLNWNSTLRTALGGCAIAALVACGGLHMALTRDFKTSMYTALVLH